MAKKKTTTPRAIGDLLGGAVDNPAIAARIEKICQQLAKQRSEKPPERAPVVQLPLWPNAIRAVPNTVLRSALFGCIQKGRRKFLDRVMVGSIEGLRVKHTGPRLDQTDLDVWEQCLHLARTSPLGDKIEFTSHSFLKAIGRGTGKSQHEWLKSVLIRLQASVVEIEEGRRGYSGQLLKDYARDDETGRNLIEVNPKISALFGHDGWTGLEWEQRLVLKRQPLAQWLHGFYSTHKNPHPYKVATIKHLCGSEAKELYKFRQQLRKAMEQVAAVTGWIWTIKDGDLLKVDKSSKKQLPKDTA